MRQFEVDGIRMVIRFTARTSLLLFCLAFGAAALARLWPNAWTRWLRRNRRYLGVSFAASHAMHAAAIAASPHGSCQPTRRRPLASYVFGGIGYAFIVAMTTTSFDRTAAPSGARAWRMLHLDRRLLPLFQFTVSFGKRIPDMPLYALFLIPLFVVFALRHDRDGPRAQGPDGAGQGQAVLIPRQMVFATKLTVHGEHGPIDVADQAVAKDHARDLPIAAVADIGQRIDTGHTRRLAARLLAQRFVRELSQFRFVLSNRHRVSKPRPY